MVNRDKIGRSNERPATESPEDAKNGPPFAMIRTTSVVIAKHPVTTSVRFSHHAATMTVTITEVITRTVRIVLRPGDGFLPEIRSESVRSNEKNAAQIKAKLKSIRFRKRPLFDSTMPT